MKIIGANITGSFILNSQDVTTTIQTSNVWSGSVATDITALNAATASLNAATASLLNYTASNNATISDILLETASINTFTSSINSRTSVIEGKYITTGSNTFVGTQYVSNTTQATTFTSTASLYTDGGLRIGKDAYVSGSAFIKGNLTVFGTSSIEYVTSSVFVGLEYIDLNTDLPALRYAGIRIYDSGSNAGVTGSFLWDSQNNRWIYSNPSGSSYSGGMLISGPRASTLGSEEGTTNNALMKGQGGDHITSSAVLDDGTSLRIPYLTIVTGTVGATTFSGSGANLTSIPNAALTNSTISGIALGSNLATLTIGTGLSGTSYNGSTGITIANTITNNNQLTNGAGYITSAGTSADSNLLNGISAVNLYNNMGAAHGTRQSFDASTPSVGFGYRYVQGNTNGPGTGGSQFYSWYIGLGSDYPATGGGSYGAMFAVDRNSSTPYLSVRFNENNSFGSWRKISAGYADTLAGGSTITGTLTMDTSGTNYIRMGRFPNSTTNTGEAWIGRASDRNTGTMTVQLGGNSASSRSFEVVDYAWSVVLFSVGSNGNATASGDVTAYSDARIKTNIKPIDSSLEKVLKLTGVTYNRTDLEDKSTKIGFIAQEIEKVVPEVVTYDSEKDKYSVSYGNVTALLVEAIKEQQTQIEELKTIINGLTK